MARIILLMRVMLSLFVIDASASLIINDVRVSVDYDDAYTYRLERRDRLSSESGLSNGSTITAEILPGANVTLTYFLENGFKSSDNIDIRNIVSKLTIEEIDDGADIEFDSDEFDLEPGNDYRIDLKFGIPTDVETGTYDIMIEAEGDDKDGNIYSTEMPLKLEVKKQSHDIRIAKTILSPSILACSRKAKFTAEVINAGQSDENDVGLEFKSSSLGINSYDLNIPLKSSEDASIEEKRYIKTLDIDIPQFVDEGRYQIIVNLFWKNYILFDREIVELEVRDCSDQSTQETEDFTEEPVVMVEEDENKTRQEPSGSQHVSFRQSISNDLVFTLIFGGVLVIGIFAAIAFRYMK